MNRRYGSITKKEVLWRKEKARNGSPWRRTWMV